jgi:crotonobetainyl-CoA:carnitine CoA-transferase CaiB-like acyl-CoA transferase
LYSDETLCVETAIVAAQPIGFSETPAPARGRWPLLGEHTRRVLTERLGMGEEEITELEAAGVVRCGGSTARHPL